MWSLDCRQCLQPGLWDGRWSNAGKHKDLTHLCSPGRRLGSDHAFVRRITAHRVIALALPPAFSQVGDYLQNLREQLSFEQLNTFDAPLNGVRDNLSTVLPTQLIPSIQGGDIRELVSSLSLRLSDAVSRLSNQSELSTTFSDALSKLKDEDINQLGQQFLQQLSARNGALVQYSEETLQQTEGLMKQVVSQLLPLLNEINDKLKNYSSNVQFDSSSLITHLNDVVMYVKDVLAQPDYLSAPAEEVFTYLSSVLQYLRNGLAQTYDVEYSPSLQNTIIFVSITVALGLIAVGISFNVRSSSSSKGDDLPSRYDPDAIEAYFSKSPRDVYSRLLQVMYEFSSFANSLLFDKLTESVSQNEKVRAAELVSLIAKLGPTSIKIGQALSIRPDILPVTYIEELQKLQDRVPPFSNEEAQQLILEGLGKPVEEVFSEMSREPVAAASLGQVYKAKLRESGETVAVKVQRPEVLEGICRDLYVLRTGAQLAQSLPTVRSNLVALLDNWAFRFFDELDYVREGENAIQFAKNMKSLPNIVVPAVYMQYTSRKVLTTQWVEGEKLSDSKAGDLLQLVKVALNCYLMQLLESGFLHADPHPGNLIRMQNGSLCVLDYGLMTQITLDQQYAFIDYISHLVNADYALVAEDLVKLGFVPPELVDPEKTASVVPQLSRVLGELVQGGGARKANFQQITQDLSSMSRDYVFVIPPYFALILRAFSVLEGIGLAADQDYTILNDCYPYLCKRLVTDDSPRTRAALKYFVYAGKERLDVTRVENIISGFQAFQSLTSITPVKTGNGSRLAQPPIDLAARQVLALVFAPNGSYLQDLLLTELVRIVDALSRDAVAEVWQYFASRALISLPPALMAPKSWPIPLPGLIFGSSRVATLSPEDQESLAAVKRIWALLEPQFVQRPSRSDMREAAGSMIPLISDLFPGMVNTGQRFVLMLLQRQALRLADDLDGKQSVTEWDKDPSAFARRVRPLMRRL